MAHFVADGWPDDAHGMQDLAAFLKGRFRPIVPFLRGCRPTRFLSHKTFRDGRGVALAQDGVDIVHENQDHQKYLSQHYELTVLPNVGHFPAREAFADVGNLIRIILDSLDEKRKHKFLI